MKEASFLERRRVHVIGRLLIGICVAYLLGFGAYLLWGRVERSRRPMALFWEAWRRLDRHFYGDLPSAQERTYGAIRAALALLDDPYTTFVEPQPTELERDQLRGAYGGIGVELRHNAEGQLVLAPYPDSPAADAGVQGGDVLLAVDDDAITGETSRDDVRLQLRGRVGTTVTLTLARPPAEPFELTIERAEVQIPSVTWRVVDGAPEVGYIHIKRFTGRTAEETHEALLALQQASVAGLILDLRDNNGGLLDPAIQIADYFLEEGVIVYQQSRGGDKTFAVENESATVELPLALLVNGGTASAAEVVAGALRDHDRAALIGESTFGKGSVQLIYDLSDGSSLRVTSAIWLTPDRHQIQGQGLSPDLPVDPGDGPEDRQLSHAVSYLQRQIDR